MALAYAIGGVVLLLIGLYMTIVGIVAAVKFGHYVDSKMEAAGGDIFNMSFEERQMVRDMDGRQIAGIVMMVCGILLFIMGCGLFIGC